MDMTGSTSTTAPDEAPAPDGSEATTLATKLVRDVILSPIGGGGLVGQAVRRLGEAVSFGLFEVGQRLPSEVDLAEQLGISVMTLREALAVMREAGYIETRRGRAGGTYVKKGTLTGSLRQAKVAEITEDYLRDLNDHRVAIGGHSAALATSRATPAEIAEMWALVERMETASDFTGFRQSDAAFHIMIASCSRSHRLVRAEAELQSELTPLLTSFTVGPQTRHATNDDHRAILSAIESRDPVAARALMEAHVTGSADALLGFVSTGNAAAAAL